MRAAPWGEESGGCVCVRVWGEGGKVVVGWGFGGAVGKCGEKEAR